MGLPTCDACGDARYGEWSYVGGRREGSIRHDAKRYCPKCAGNEIERLREECDGWQQLVNDSERAIGMTSVATSPEARSLVEWCDEVKAENERLRAELRETQGIRRDILE